MALIEVLVPVAQQRRRSAVHLCRGGIGDLADATTVYENPATTTTGDEFPLQAYSAQMFGAQGHLVEQLQDLSVDEREELAVDGAREAQLLTVTFFQPQLDEQVVQTVVLVRTDTTIYDLRYAAVESLHDADIASMLPDTVRLP